MSWKRVIVGSGGNDGRVLPQDLITEGLANSSYPQDPQDIGKVLKIIGSADGGELGWQEDTSFAHPSGGSFGDDIAISTGLLSGGTVISALAVAMTSDTDGHITAASGSETTRTLSLADLAYTGTSDANHYVHPNDFSNNNGSGGSGTETINETLLGNQVIRTINLSRTVNNRGHVTDHHMAVTTGEMDLADLGYTGDPAADQYDNWKLAVESGSPVDITSSAIVNFVAGENLIVDGTSSGNTQTITLSAAPAAIGMINTVSAGDGMNFVQGSDSVPDVTISMGTPHTVSAHTGNGFSGTGHTHAIATTSDGSTDGTPNRILQTDGNGALTLQELTVADSLSVNGDDVILGSSEIQIEDAAIQLNFDTVAGNAYNTGSSAIIFGHSDLLLGGKIINHVDGAIHFMAFTDLHSTNDTADSNGSADLGQNSKTLKMGPTTIDGRLVAYEVDAVGTVSAGTDMSITDTLTMTEQSATPSSSTDGEMYFDGEALWVNIE